MEPTVPPPDRPRARPVSAANALLVPFAGAAALLAAYVFWLHLGELPRHRVNVRWAPAASDADRHAFEQRTGLVAAQATDARTWSYQLRDQSPGNIRRIVESPLVEDTAQLDRARFRVQLSWPGRPRWLRQLAEAQRLPLLGTALLALAAAGMWRARAAIGAILAAVRSGGN